MGTDVEPDVLHVDADALCLAKIREWCVNGRAREIRIANRLSQAEVAKPIAATQAAVSRWECGQRLPSGEVALAYLRLLESLARRLVA